MAVPRKFLWKNMQAYVRSCIEPHIVAVRNTFDSYVKFNDERFAKFKKWTEDEVDRLDERITTEIKALHDKIFVPEGDACNETFLTYVNSQNGIPIGTVIFWPFIKDMPLTIDPNNVRLPIYIECDGRPIPTNPEYNELKSLCGDYTPDYNMLFVRCVGKNSLDHQGTPLLEHDQPATPLLIPHRHNIGKYREDVGPVKGYMGYFDTSVLSAFNKSTSASTKYSEYAYAGDRLVGGSEGLTQDGIEYGNECRPRHIPMRFYIRARHAIHPKTIV